MAKGTQYGTRQDTLTSRMGGYGKGPTIKMVSAKQNADVLTRLVKDWHLGPEKASEEPTANKPYWVAFGVAMNNVSEAQARRMLCANCEYYDNTPEMQQAMETVPMTKFDLDGGGRGFCNRFDFICHNLRTCQGWEKKYYQLPD